MVPRVITTDTAEELLGTGGGLDKGKGVTTGKLQVQTGNPTNHRKAATEKEEVANQNRKGAFILMSAAG
eukprot:CAMPEP_0174358334 /NCGR_PEP_ID=MMETSP0811_2-20130205/42037_1 /TAXON_ID=73025 ORGANISM="Eutreptiella gymnastica-like, Strain CCMP1594" /NCGR_SAMPLE_ID=MMETSP0811_2 /ASSEMBLY_ACC=CAM_ASM_000667 /LENGTH=68 /DNA_ID=CAMNT_0015492021 /DNA_START=302 /DNA_END=508 /DNA_ORIENTATION=-